MRGLSQARLLLTFAGAGTAAAAGYSLLLLAAATRAPRRRAGAPPEGERRRLVVLVPAHDEQDTVGATIRSLLAVDYPADRWRVVVVADNCSDGTAPAAAAAGAEVLERADGARHGKGHALAHGFAAVLDGNEPPDAVVVVDADCQVSPNLAAEVDRGLAEGARAVQTANTVSNPCESTYSALRYAAFAAINGTRPRGADRLGLSAGLQGTGMAFAASLLRERPWHTFGLAEDREYHLSLVAAGERVRFAGEATVSSPMPTSFDAATTQQQRWEGGRAALVGSWVPRLLSASLRRRRPAPAVAAVELAMPPLTIQVAATAAVAALGLASRSRGASRLALLALLGQGVYVVGSLRLARAPDCVYRALTRVPIMVAWQLRLSLVGARSQSQEWVRTEREQVRDDSPRTV